MRSQVKETMNKVTNHASPPAAPPPATSEASGAGRPGPLVVNMPAARVGTREQTPGAGAPDLRLPHERDQSAIDTAPVHTDDRIAQAAKDLAAGQVDTDLHNPGGQDDEQRRRLMEQARHDEAE